jgi:putative Mn2+ efflux pump MntP
MLYKAIRHEPIDEKLREIGYKRIVLEALMVALFTFLAGIGWGFIGHNIYRATGIIACATVIAVITGIFTGFKEGCLFRYLIYGVGGCMLAFVGVDILVRYI